MGFETAPTVTNPHQNLCIIKQSLWDLKLLLYPRTSSRATSIIKQSLWDLKHDYFVNKTAEKANNKAVPMGFETV